MILDMTTSSKIILNFHEFYNELKQPSRSVLLISVSADDDKAPGARVGSCLTR